MLQAQKSKVLWLNKLDITHLAEAMVLSLNS